MIYCVCTLFDKNAQPILSFNYSLLPNNSIQFILMQCHAMQRYDDIRANLAEIKDDLEVLKDNFANQESILTERADKWKVYVQAIQDKLNTSFAEYMTRLQYTGQVELRVTGTFMDWGKSKLGVHLFLFDNRLLSLMRSRVLLHNTNYVDNLLGVKIFFEFECSGACFTVF